MCARALYRAKCGVSTTKTDISAQVKSMIMTYKNVALRFGFRREKVEMNKAYSTFSLLHYKAYSTTKPTPLQSLLHYKAYSTF